MGRLFSGSILPIYWKLFGIKNCSKAHGALFQCLYCWLELYFGPLGSCGDHRNRCHNWWKNIWIFLQHHSWLADPFLVPKNQLMHTDATYGICDMWNYALEWYQVVLGCLRVHKSVFTKIAITEVNFSHRPKIAILWVCPNCTHFRQLL